jgi:hypothetical protein
VLWGLLAVLAWDLSGLDVPLAQWVGGPNGFPWQFHPLLSNVLHQAARTLGWAVLGALTLLAIWPLGPLKQLTPRERAGLVGSVWAASKRKSLMMRQRMGSDLGSRSQEVKRSSWTLF